MPVLREMVELLFAKGYVKILFATETFAVGINMPTKTVVFTDVNKYDGSGMRMLYSHEFTQMAGRAGRRGIDTIGNVIHLNNLFKNCELTDYRNMLKGKPQTLVSKFKISYNLLLNLIDIGDYDFTKFAKRSMIQENIDAELGIMYYKIIEQELDLEKCKQSLQYLNTPFDVAQKYLNLQKNRKTAINKKQKDIDKEIYQMHNEYKNIESDIKQVTKYNNINNELLKLKNEYETTDKYLQTNVQIIIQFLEKGNFVIKNNQYQINNEPPYKLTLSGNIATHLKEVHCLVFAKLLDKNRFDNITTKQLICILSCFTNITVSDEYKTHYPYYMYKNVKIIVDEIMDLYKYYQDYETSVQINTGMEYEIHFDIFDYMQDWVNAESVADCKLVLQRLEKEKEIFLGEFIKAILKINNISNEMEKIAESIGNISLLSKLHEIPSLTQKFVATNQSLYI
jgi:superfamily II RNA helicase